ncbi:carboxylesterase/lipase family protein [Rhodococcoides yunnanense]|uniref:carboxylesterase/lipase family protein n=1 Tax=Rhodococcoides yunnanense TaxID=278209 RepID=UPI0009323CA1|nr:carboxylesterase/lipase family protein [Rhodococcus yunnanensis]
MIARTVYGQVEGIADDGIAVWKGIPYAAPPVGDGRLRAPVTPGSWSGVRSATEFGRIAPQSAQGPMPIDPSLTLGEDCLTLNVWAPQDRHGLPVMVWIHGGAYFIGSSAQRMFDGRTLVREGGVVLVTVNYRLGALGFLDFSSFGDFDSNLGLRDQIAALEWVRENISAFGGDPSNVTLFGESAGGGAVTTLLTSPSAEGLFHRAIAESSPATSVYGSARASSIAERFLELAGVQADRLRDMPVSEFVRAGAELVQDIPSKVPGTLAVAPTVDGDIVPHYPVASFQKGRQLQVPLLIGTNRDEASLFKLMKSPLMPITPDKIHEMFQAIAADHPQLPADEEAEIALAYPHYPSKKTAMEISRDAAFRMPTLWIAEAHSRLAPTYVYRFDHASPLFRLTGIGATHGTEVPYVFGNFGVIPKDPTYKLGGRKSAQIVARRMRQRWIDFAHGRAPWTAYDETNRTTLLIDKQDREVDDPDRDLRRAWGEEVVAYT